MAQVSIREVEDGSMCKSEGKKRGHKMINQIWLNLGSNRGDNGKINKEECKEDEKGLAQMKYCSCSRTNLFIRMRICVSDKTKQNENSHKHILLFERVRVMATACWRMNGVINSTNVNVCVSVCVFARVQRAAAEAWNWPEWCHEGEIRCHVIKERHKYEGKKNAPCDTDFIITVMKTVGRFMKKILFA